MPIVAILFLSLVSLVFSDFRIGGSTCNFADSGSCSANNGSGIIDIPAGVYVDGVACEIGEGSTRGVSYAFDVEEDGFYQFDVQGLGGYDAALLVFSGEEADADGCSAWLTVSESWTGFTEAGSYVAVVTNNGGDFCINFTATATHIVYEFVGTTDTEIQYTQSPISCNLQSLRVGSFTFISTDANTTYNAIGQLVGDIDGLSFIAAIFATDNLPVDMNDNMTMCAEYENNSVVFDSSSGSYPLEVGVEYTIFVSGFDISSGTYIEGDFYLNIVQVLPEIEPETIECDEIPAEPKNYNRPSVPAVGITNECNLDDNDFVFDVFHTSYETDVFFVVDAIYCGDTSFDSAVVLYYGEYGTEADDENDAVAPETCDNFVLAGDSGDGGAAFYWFPANVSITVVPTTFSSFNTGGTYTLVMNTYEMVGCIPENRFFDVDTESDSSLTVNTDSDSTFVVDTDTDTSSSLNDATDTISSLDDTSDIDSSSLSLVVSFTIILIAL